MTRRVQDPAVERGQADRVHTRGAQARDQALVGEPREHRDRDLEGLGIGDTTPRHEVRHETEPPAPVAHLGAAAVDQHGRRGERA